jgi:hypothetical protein
LSKSFDSGTNGSFGALYRKFCKNNKMINGRQQFQKENISAIFLLFPPIPPTEHNYLPKGNFDLLATMVFSWVVIGIVSIFTVWFFFLRGSTKKPAGNSTQNKASPAPTNLATKPATDTPASSAKPNIIREVPNLKLSNPSEEFSFAPTSFALPTITILYGTQKGTAERFAKELSKQAIQKGWTNVEVMDVESYEFDALSSEDIVLLIVATYIEGT